MKKKKGILLMGLMLFFALAACGSSDKSAYSDYAAAEEAAVEEPAALASYGNGDYMTDSAGEAAFENETISDDVKKETARKLIKTVNLDVETKSYDEMLAFLETQIEELDGYIEALDCYGRDYRHASVTARIPAGKLDGFVKQIGETANVTGRSESVEDVTLQYVDLDSHARMLEEEQERLLELLETAETIEDMITIESRLGEIKYQLESMKSQLRTFDNRVDYSTVHINIEEVIELTPVVELTDGERIVQGFIKSVADVTNGIKEFFITLIINIPYIIVWAVVILIIVVIARIIMKKVDKRTERLEKERGERIASGNYQNPYVTRPSTATGKKNEVQNDKNVTEEKTE